MNVKILFGTALLVTLSACGNHSGGNASVPDDGLRKDLRSGAMKATPLTADQKASMALVLKAQAALEPATSLYFPSTSSSGDKDTQDQLKKLNDTGLGFLKKVKESCAIDGGKDVETGDASVGSTHVVVRAKSISGPKCPLILTSKETTTSKTTAFDKVLQIASGTSHAESTETKEYTDADFKKSLPLVSGTSSTVTDVTFSGAGETSGSSDLKSGSIAVTSSSTTSGKMQDGQAMSGSSEVEYISRPGQKNFQLSLTVQLPQLPPMVMFVVAHNKSFEIIVNGESYTPERFHNDFGMSLDLSN